MTEFLKTVQKKTGMLQTTALVINGVDERQENITKKVHHFWGHMYMIQEISTVAHFNLMVFQL